MYSIVNYTWTWVGGYQTVNSEGVYEEKGYPSQNYIPHARRLSGTWTDEKNKKFWLFGGYDVNSNSMSSF